MGSSPLHCKLTTKGSNHAGVIKPHFPGGGYQLVGGGMNNHYRSFNHLSPFEEAFPHGNHFQCDTGFGAGRLTCYAMYCKKAGMLIAVVVHGEVEHLQAALGSAGREAAADERID